MQRPPWFWSFWEFHARCVVGAKKLHTQVVALQLAIAMRSVSAEQEVTLDEVAPPQPTVNREFDMVFQISAWDGSIPQEFSLEYGGGMASRIVSWWRERTAGQGSADPTWVSFAHLYVDYQLTWGCAGPVQSGKHWVDVFTRPYIEAERNNFLMRVKWFRRSLKVFWRLSGQHIGLAQCRPTGTCISSFVTCASLQWDGASLAQADQWLLENCKEPCHRGTTALKHLPLARKLAGMRVDCNLQSEVVSLG